MDHSLSAGETVAHYRILSLLGEGGMGQVYLAEDSKLDRRVALKILPPDLAADATRMRRFITEAKSASAVRHPNVAHIYDVGEAKGVHYIAMEYIEGRTLSARMNEPECDFPFVLETAIQIVDALDEAHSSGIVHRDLKPANVMITRRGQLKVLDFGLARMSKPDAQSENTALSTHSFTSPGMVMGTVPYMSPEQVLGKPVDARSDLFSMGIVLYEMLTRKLPFSGNTVPELMDSILHKQPEPMFRFNHDAPQEMERIARKCLEKSPEDRYQSARDLLVDLRNLKREGSSATEVIAQTIITPKGKRRWFIPAAILLLAGITGWIALSYLRKDQPRSIAVLPFENMSKDADLEYLSEGIPESLINCLSQVPYLTVISRTSSFSYKARPFDLRKIAGDLNVEAILTGRITQRGNDLAVSVELIDAKDQRQLWGEKYNRQLSGIAGMPEEISETIVENLRMRFSGEKKQQLTNQYTKDSEALQLYMKGRYYWNQATEEATRKAIDFFQQAIAKDPSFALAYSGLADAYAYVFADANIPPREAVPRAQEAVKKALELDPTLADAKTVEGVIAMFYEYDFKKSEEKFKEAISLNPNYAFAHHQYGWCLEYQGRFTEAFAELQKAQELDPLSPVINVDLNVPFTFSGHYAKGLEYLDKARDLDPNFFLVYFVYGATYNLKGDFQRSIDSLNRAKGLYPAPMILGELGNSYARLGNVKKAEDLLNELLQLSRNRYVSPYHSAIIYMGLNRQNEAISMLSRAYEENDPWLLFLKIEGRLNPLRSNPEFQKLYQHIHYQ